MCRPNFTPTKLAVVTAIELAAAIVAAGAINLAAGAPSSALARSAALPATGLLSGIADDTRHITVRWAAVPGAQRYQVLRQSPGYSMFVQIQATSFLDSGIGPGQTHRYQVRAMNGSGAGAAAVIYVKTPLPKSAAAAQRRHPRRYLRASRKCLKGAPWMSATIVSACVRVATKAAT